MKISQQFFLSKIMVKGINNLETIFEPFQTTKDLGKGLGLGLAISSNIISELGGMLQGKIGHRTVQNLRLFYRYLTLVRLILEKLKILIQVLNHEGSYN